MFSQEVVPGWYRLAWQCPVFASGRPPEPSLGLEKSKEKEVTDSEEEEDERATSAAKNPPPPDRSGPALLGAGAEDSGTLPAVVLVLVLARSVVAVA